MSILSKICVVVLTVASLVAMVVIIQLATVEPNYKNLYEQEKSKVKLAEQKAQSAEVAFAEAQGRIQAEINKRLESEKALRDKNKTLNTELSTAKVRQTELESQLSAVNSKLTKLEKGMDRHASNNQVLSKNLEDSWKRGNELEKLVISLGEQLKEEQAKSFRLDRTTKVLREQVEEFRQAVATKNNVIAELRKGGTTAANTGNGGTVVTDKKIMGAIDAVQNNLASINVGSANGIKTGMKLIIYRGSKFVGYLKVEEVRLSSAAGIILDKQMTPKAGDKVISNLN